MSQARLEQLLEYLKEEPEDPFLLYAVATEYAKTDVSKAQTYYEILLREHPSYVATYYHAARLYAALGKREKAEQVFLKGTEIAAEQQDSLALRELQNAYQEFLYDE